jgi:hypothetical protein
MKNKMPFLLLDEIICFYKVTSKYTTKFLAGHYVVHLTYHCCLFDI